MRRKYIAIAESNEERMEFGDNSQFKVVSHSPSLDLDNICEKIKNNVDLYSFTHIEFDKLGNFEMNQVEKSIYAMMETFK